MPSTICASAHLLAQFAYGPDLLKMSDHATRPIHYILHRKRKICIFLNRNLTSSATAIRTNSNCCRVATKPARWSLRCSSVAAISISRAPLFMRASTKSSKIYAPVRPAPLLLCTTTGHDRPRYDLFTLRRNSNSALAATGTPAAGHDKKWNCVTVRVSDVFVFFR